MVYPSQELPYKAKIIPRMIYMSVIGRGKVKLMEQLQAGDYQQLTILHLAGICK